ncbi:MAG: glycosyl hydrolase 108 family protein [Minisyncoccia bacterium]
MRENYLTKALPFTLDREGGYTVDAGGPTWKGVSAKQYPALRDRIIQRKLTDDEIAGIYLADYWIPAGCDTLPWPLDCVVFDCAVNLGLDDVEVMLPEVPKIVSHLTDLFANLGSAYGESGMFNMARPYLEATVYVALRIEKHNVKTPKEARKGTVNRCYLALKTFL